MLVNHLLRLILDSRRSARASLVPYARQLAAGMRMNWQHVSTAIQVALSLAKGHRRRLRQHSPSSPPYVHRPFLRADDKTFHFDLTSGRLRLSLRAGEWVGLVVHVPEHHRTILSTPGTVLKQFVVLPDRLVAVWARESPEPYVPKSLLAFDTNERSLDGVEVRPDRSGLVRVPFPEVATVQERHFVRRRRLGRKKSHDRRVGRRLLGREGRREHARVGQRLHDLSNRLVATAASRHAAIALEDLTCMPARRRRHSSRSGLPRSRALRSRLSSWPRRELHRQIAYKAQARGVPVFWIDPRYTSMSCPKCGVRKDRRSRVGAVFECSACGWRKDRQLNAGLNIARTVLAERRELGGLRLDLDALLDDAMNPLYPPTEVEGHGRSGGEGRDGSSMGGG